MKKLGAGALGLGALTVPAASKLTITNNGIQKDGTDAFLGLTDSSTVNADLDLNTYSLKDSQGTLTVDSKTEFTGDIQDNNANTVYNQTDSEIPSGRLEQIDSSISYVEEGQDSNKPSAGTNGRYYYSTDTQILYRDNGTSWTAISGTGTSDNKIPDQYVQSLTADAADITGESFVVNRLTANQDSSGSNFSSGTWVDLADTEDADGNNEQDSSFNFNPDESGWYLVVARGAIFNATDQDRMRIAIRDVDNGSVVQGGQLDTNISDAKDADTMVAHVNLSSGTNYKVQITDATGGFKVNGGEDQGYSIVRSVVHP